MSARVDPILTVADLDLMPDDDNRYELFEGEIFVSRAPGLPHQTVLANLLTLIRVFLAQNPAGKVWPTPGVILDNFNAAIPDIVFVSTERLEAIASGEKVTGAPDLVIEVVSQGVENERRDKTVKRQAYSKFGVNEYWVVDRYHQTIEVYRLKEGQLVLVTTLADGDQLTTPLLPAFTCLISQVFEG
ncbi:MAG: Uma2 family endonuclease [Pyrinomonadaceae bacterium]|nr:Uma2 family endonuclease [Pyrinomonadaceae bacterium]